MKPDYSSLPRCFRVLALRLRSRRQPLADVGWHAGPQHDLLPEWASRPPGTSRAKKNVKWMAELGSQSYGNPVVAGGQVYVGTNNELVRNPKEGGDRGVLMCFRESDGQFLWQHTNEKLAAGRANDWPVSGSLLLAAGRGRPPLLRLEPRRVDLPGHARRREGQRQGDLEVRHDGGGWRRSSTTWPNSSPVSYGDLVFVGTATGIDESHVRVASPRAPSMIAVNKNTGKLVWEVNNVGRAHSARAMVRARGGHPSAAWCRS